MFCYLFMACWVFIAAGSLSLVAVCVLLVVLAFLAVEHTL